MTDTNLLPSPVESTIIFMGTKVDVTAEVWYFAKKRRIKARKRHGRRGGKALDLAVSFHNSEEEGGTVNEAEVHLLPDELPIFTKALIQHPILFPSNYSQRVTRTHDTCCMCLKSLEPFEAFGKRLSDALAQLR